MIKGLNTVVDKKIREKFQLFCGKRNENDDEQIYERVYELCFAEMMLAIEERLEPYRREVLLSQLEKIEESSLDAESKQMRCIELIMNSIEDDPSFRLYLESRLTAFIEHLKV